MCIVHEESESEVKTLKSFNQTMKSRKAKKQKSLEPLNPLQSGFQYMVSVPGFLALDRTRAGGEGGVGEEEWGREIQFYRSTGTEKYLFTLPGPGKNM